MKCLQSFKPMQHVGESLAREGAYTRDVALRIPFVMVQGKRATRRGMRAFGLFAVPCHGAFDRLRDNSMFLCMLATGFESMQMLFFFDTVFIKTFLHGGRANLGRARHTSTFTVSAFLMEYFSLALLGRTTTQNFHRCRFDCHVGQNSDIYPAYWKVTNPYFHLAHFHCSIYSSVLFRTRDGNDHNLLFQHML